MSDAELIVLANLVSFPERAFEVVGGLHLREEDFSEGAHRAAYAELVRLGPVTSEKLLKAVLDFLPELKGNDKAVDGFLALAPSVAEVEHHLCGFAEGVARAKMQKDILALMSDGTMPADLLPKAVDKAKEDFEARLADIGRVRGSFVPDDGDDFDGTVPTPEELMDVPGFVNLLADYTYRTAPRYNRVLAFAGALAMISCLAGRKFTDRRRTMPNLYLVALAGSGCGKDHPRKVNKRLAVAVNSGSVADQIASGQGLEDALLTNPVRLFEMDEFDTLLNELKEKSALSEGMMKYILNFFSESGSFHTMRKKALTDHEREHLASGGMTGGDVVIPYPSLSLFATAIPEHFYKALSLRSLTNGLLARCLVFEAGKRESRGEGPFDLPFPDEVLQTAQMLVGRTEEKDWQQKPRLVVVPDDEGVDAALAVLRQEEDRLYAACEQNRDEAGMAIWSRGVELASKLALLYAVSENPAIPRISVRGVEWSWKLVKYSAGRMLKMAEAYVSDDKEDSDAQEILRYLRPFKSKGAKHSQVSRTLHLSRKRMEEAIATLLEREAVEKWSGKGGATYYRVKKGGAK